MLGATAPNFSRMCGAALLPWRGETRSAGVHFDWPKWTKSHLGRSPLRTSLWVRGWTCVKSKFGPSPLLWRLVLPPHQATLGSWPYSQVVSTSGPTLAKRRSRRREFCRTSCGAVVGAVACPARGYPGIALGNSGGASPSPTPSNARNAQFLWVFCAKPSKNCAAKLPTAGNSGSPG